MNVFSLKKSKVILVLSLLFLVSYFALPKQIFANNTPCSTYGIQFSGMRSQFYAEVDAGFQNFQITGLENPDTITKIQCRKGDQWMTDLVNGGTEGFSISNKTIYGRFGMSCYRETGNHTVILEQNGAPLCTLHTYSVLPTAAGIECIDVSLTNSDGNNCLDNNDYRAIIYKATIINKETRTPISTQLKAFPRYSDNQLDTRGKNANQIEENSERLITGSNTLTSNSNGGLFYPMGDESDIHSVEAGKWINVVFSDKSLDFIFLGAGQNGLRRNQDVIASSCTGNIIVTPAGQCTDNFKPPLNQGIQNSNPFNLCEQVSDDTASGQSKSPRQACKDCQDTNGIWTALGCIPTDGAGTVRTFISIALGMAGGIGLLMIIAAGAMFALSQNDPTKVNSARDLLTSVIIGLLFIVFSVTILQFIGVTILQIPGFGT